MHTPLVNQTVYIDITISADVTGATQVIEPLIQSIKGILRMAGHDI